MKKIVIIIFTLFTLSIKAQDITTQTLYSYMVEIDIQHPEIVMAQAKLESGRFKSIIFRENNNLFGMRLPVRRKTTAIGKNRGYAVYRDWKSSVRDYKLWQDRMINKGNSDDDYLRYLQEHYAKNEQYIRILRKMICKF